MKHQFIYQAFIETYEQIWGTTNLSEFKKIQKVLDNPVESKDIFITIISKKALEISRQNNLNAQTLDQVMLSQGYGLINHKTFNYMKRLATFAYEYLIEAKPDEDLLIDLLQHYMFEHAKSLINKHDPKITSFCKEQIRRGNSLLVFTAVSLSNSKELKDLCVSLLPKYPRGNKIFQLVTLSFINYRNTSKITYHFKRDDLLNSSDFLAAIYKFVLDNNLYEQTEIFSLLENTKPIFTKEALEFTYDFLADSNNFYTIANLERYLNLNFVPICVDLTDFVVGGDEELHEYILKLIGENLLTEKNISLKHLYRNNCDEFIAKMFKILTETKQYMNKTLANAFELPHYFSVSNEIFTWVFETLNLYTTDHSAAIKIISESDSSKKALIGILDLDFETLYDLATDGVISFNTLFSLNLYCNGSLSNKQQLLTILDETDYQAISIGNFEHLLSQTELEDVWRKMIPKILETKIDYIPNEAINNLLAHYNKLNSLDQEKIIDFLDLNCYIKYNYSMPVYANPNAFKILDQVYLNSDYKETFKQIIITKLKDPKVLRKQLKDCFFNSGHSSTYFATEFIKNQEIISEAQAIEYLQSTIHLKSQNPRNLNTRIFEILSREDKEAIITANIASTQESIVDSLVAFLETDESLFEKYKDAVGNGSKLNREAQSIIENNSNKECQVDYKVLYPGLDEYIKNGSSDLQVNTSTVSKLKSLFSKNKSNQFDFKINLSELNSIYAKLYNMISDITDTLDEGMITNSGDRHIYYPISLQIRRNEEKFKDVAQYIYDNITLKYNSPIDSAAIFCSFRLNDPAFSSIPEDIKISLSLYIHRLGKITIDQKYNVSDLEYANICKLTRLSQFHNLSGENITSLPYGHFNLDFANIKLSNYNIYNFSRLLKIYNLNYENFIFFRLIEDVIVGHATARDVVNFLATSENISLPRGFADKHFYDDVESGDEYLRVAREMQTEKLARITAGVDPKSNYFGTIYGSQNLVAMLKVSKITKGFNYSKFESYIRNTTLEEDQEVFNRNFSEIELTQTEFFDLALFNPSFAPYIGNYINMPMLESIVLFFTAHDPGTIYGKTKEAIAKYTSLSVQDFDEGRIDRAWFNNIVQKESLDFINEVRARQKNSRSAKVLDALMDKVEKREAIKKIEATRNKDMLIAYSVISPEQEKEHDLLKRIKLYRDFKKSSRQFGSQRRATEAKLTEGCLQNLGETFKLGEIFSLEMFDLEYKENINYFDGISIGEYTLKVIEDNNSLKLTCFKAEKKLKSIPASLKKEAAEIKLVISELNGGYKMLKDDLEQMMITQTELSNKALLGYTTNAIINNLLNNIIFETTNNKLLIYSDGIFRDEDGRECYLNEDDKLKIAHVTSIIRSDKYFIWKQIILDNKLVQPFKQLFREAYFKLDDELNETLSYRYSGHLIKVNVAFSILKNIGWKSDYYSIYKTFKSANIRAELWGYDGWYYEDFYEENSIEEIRFYDLSTNKPILINDIDPIAYSEIMRDFDLAVTVAHVGEIDKELGLSTVDIRIDVLGVNRKLFKLDNLSVDKHKVKITGKLGNYVVNLKSGDAYKEGRGQLILFPINVKANKDVYLPYIDKNSKTQEIMSLIVLLSRDDQIKNQTVIQEVLH